MPYVNTSPPNCLTAAASFRFYFLLLFCMYSLCVCVYYVYPVPMKASKGPLGSPGIKVTGGFEPPNTDGGN